MINNHLKPRLNSQCCFNGSVLLWAIRSFYRINLCSQLSIVSALMGRFFIPQMSIEFLLCPQYFVRCWVEPRGVNMLFGHQKYAQNQEIVLGFGILCYGGPKLMSIWSMSTFSIFLTPPFSVLLSIIHYFFVLFSSDVCNSLNSYFSFYSMVPLHDIPSKPLPFMLPRERRINKN